MLVAAGLSVVLVMAAVMVHFKGLTSINRFAVSPAYKLTEWHLMVVIFLILCLHLFEICIFSGGIFLAHHVLHLGDFLGKRDFSLMDYFHFSAETFTTVGYGDLYPVGPLRLLASLEGIVGVLLISWSGAFSYFTVQKLWDSHEKA